MWELHRHWVYLMRPPGPREGWRVWGNRHGVPTVLSSVLMQLALSPPNTTTRAGM